MDELDMSGVDAMRWPEVRRRVGVVQDFLKIAHPDERDQRDHAERLGLSVNQFLALVRAWRLHGSPARMAGSGAHRGSTRRPSRISVAKAAKDAAAKIIEESGPDAPLAGIVEAVAARCVTLNVAPPSRSTLWNMVMAWRRNVQGRGQGLIVGTCAVRLPMRAGDTLVLPTLSLAVREENGVIIAAALNDVDWTGFLADMARRQPDIRIDQALCPAALVEGVTPVLSTVARSAISRIIGRGIDKVGLIYQPSKAIAPARLLRTKEDRPLSPADVRAVLDTAITQHNSGRVVESVSWLDANCWSAA